MEEIKVGEHVRTKNGKIRKVINIAIDEEDEENTLYFVDKYECYNPKDICANSENIIDLIEAGDILEVYFPIRKITKKIVVDEYFKDSMILNGINFRKIFLKTILTKEQFARESYKVEE